MLMKVLLVNPNRMRPGFSAMPEAVLRYLDAEGEEALPQLLRALRGDENLSEVSGLIHRAGDRFVRNPIRYIDLTGPGLQGEEGRMRRGRLRG